MKNIKFYKDILLYCSALFPISQLDVHIHKFFMLNACVFGFGFVVWVLWVLLFVGVFWVGFFGVVLVCVGVLVGGWPPCF